MDYVTKNEFVNSFAKFKYNHAITVHKSQGSTYKILLLMLRILDLTLIYKRRDYFIQE
jgi:ATP-dependent exoDNAse (exonuclease V) alpha subunit